MAAFSIEEFAEGCKAAMREAADPQEAAHAYLQQTLETSDPSEIKACLEAAVPDGADIGELIVHCSPELTMLYARIPPYFQSGIHNHTIFACIAQLEGEEVGIAYEPDANGTGLREAGRGSTKPGETVSLPADVIHRIENPHGETGAALHIYGGDFSAVMEQRSLWSWEDHQEKAFTFPDLLAESVKAMRASDNDKGLAAVAEAIPAAAPLVHGSA